MSLLITELAYSLSLLISAMLLTRCCPMVLQRYAFNLRNPLNDRSAEHDVAGITARICTTLETLGTYQIDHSRALSATFLKQSNISETVM